MTGAGVTFDFGEWKSDVGSRKNPDGTVSFLTTSPGAMGFEFVVGPNAGAKRPSTFATRSTSTSSPKSGRR